MNNYYYTHTSTNLTDDLVNYRDNIIATKATGLSSIRPLSNVKDIISENCDDKVYNCGNLDGDSFYLLVIL